MEIIPTNYGDDRDHVLTVYYTEQTYTVEASIVAENADNKPGGTLTPPSKTVNKGDDQTVTWTIAEGYEIVKVEVDGKENNDLLDKNSYTFTDISANHTVKVTTRPIEYSRGVPARRKRQAGRKRLRELRLVLETGGYGQELDSGQDG